MGDLRIRKRKVWRVKFMKNYVFYFLVGSQYLYGPEAIEQVNADAEKIAAGLN